MRTGPPAAGLGRPTGRRAARRRQGRPADPETWHGEEIPCDQPGRHRRIGFTDLLAFAERRHEGRRAALDQMTEDAGEAGIYGGTPEDYAAALKKARRRAARPESAS